MLQDSAIKEGIKVVRVSTDPWFAKQLDFVTTQEIKVKNEDDQLAHLSGGRSEFSCIHCLGQMSSQNSVLFKRLEDKTLHKRLL